MYYQPHSLLGVLPKTSASRVDYYFAGHSLGFSTQYQSFTSGEYDSFVHKYNFFEDLDANDVNFFSCLTAKASATTTV